VFSSRAIDDVLRTYLGLTGAVFSDSLSSRAISASGRSVDDAAVQALRAGVDVVLFGTGETTDGTRQALRIRAAVVAAVADGTLTRTRLVQAVTRAAAAVGVPTC
jgi:beta-N-acetylhexosaminidase